MCVLNITSQLIYTNDAILNWFIEREREKAVILLVGREYNCTVALSRLMRYCWFKYSRKAFIKHSLSWESEILR